MSPKHLDRLARLALLGAAVTTLGSLTLITAASPEPDAPAAVEEPGLAAAAADEFVPPQVILGTQIRPEYPPAALAARYAASVLVELTVLQDGTVGEVKVLKCTRPKVGFEEAVVTALKKWRFEPGTKGGKPVEVTTTLNLNFTRGGVDVASEARVSAGGFTVTDVGDPGSGGERSGSSSPARR
jgi:TonB family protein